jgi:hypothetical protein
MDYKMSQHSLHCLKAAALLALFYLPQSVWAVPVTGHVNVTSPSGQHLALQMTITDTTTTFELTGPDYSWFAWGFDTTVMQGYSLIIEGTDDSRTAHERNLIGTGNPGAPQAHQDISIISTTHDALNDLTTIVIERPNNTGDSEDPVFSTSMTPLDVIWAYRASASPASPSPALNFHGPGGRGSTSIRFLPVPELATFHLASLTVILLGGRGRIRRR